MEKKLTAKEWWAYKRNTSTGMAKDKGYYCDKHFPLLRMWQYLTEKEIEEIYHKEHSSTGITKPI